jgi:hypothetical protein
MVTNDSATRLSDARAEEVLAKTTSASVDLVKQFYADMARDKEAALKIADPGERKQKIALIDAKIADVRKEETADTTDIAKVIGAVLAKEQELDAGFEQMSTYTDVQKEQLKEKEDALKAAEKAVADASQSFTWFGLADPKAAANATLERVKIELAELKTRLDKQVRDGILKADFETSIKTLQVRMERSVRGLSKHHDVLTVAFGVTTDSKTKAFEAASTAAREKERLDGVIEELERQLSAKSEGLASIIEKSKQLDAEQEIADLKMQIEQATNARNSALGTQMEQNKAAADFSSTEVTLLQEIGTMKNLIDIMTVKIQNLPILRSKYVDVMKGGAIIEIGKTLLQVGDKSADTMAERITRAGQAAVNARHEYYGAQPQELEKKIERRRAQEAATIQNIKNDELIAKAFADAGVDLDRVFVHKDEGAAAGV